MTRTGALALGVLGLAMLGIHAVLAVALFRYEHQLIFHWIALEVALYAAAVPVVLLGTGRAVSPRAATIGILLVAAALRLPLLFADPISTDINRYVWDGRVQNHGINPYRYIPADPALAPLRDEDIYPEINRRDYAPTIYPPLAEVVFLLVTRVSEQVWVMKAVMVGFECIALWAVWRLLAMRGMPSTRLLLFAWHPLPVWEFAGSGHVDAVALACVFLALLAAEKGKQAAAGLALAGALLTKLYPVLIAPAVYRRWRWSLPASLVGATLLFYLPYLGVGRKAFGFLSGYSAEEGLKDGSGLYLWLVLKKLGAPQELVGAYLPAAAATLAAIGVYVLFRQRRPGEAGGQGASIGGAFLLAIAFTALMSPHYPWYLAWLVPFLCFFPSPAVLWLTCSAGLMYIAGWPPSFAAGSFFYLPFFVLLIGEETIRRFRA